MAKDNKIVMPSSGAGLMRYTEGYKSNMEISPQLFMIFSGIVIALLIGLHISGI